MKRMKGIRKRWMMNSISAALLVVLLAVTSFSVAMVSYYYSNLRTGLQSKITVAANMFSGYKTEADYYQNASAFVTGQFEDSDRLNFQILDSEGVVHFSSLIQISGYKPDTPDIHDALSGQPMGIWTGADPNTEEHIMALSCPLKVNGEVVSVIRIVTSLALVDRQIFIVVGVALTVGLLVLALLYFSGLFFVRSIVEPVVQITRTAEHIAAGSYGVQMEKQFDDEVGDLIDAINDMSLKIKQSEKMKNEFISSVSHELRTPLTAINGWAETIMNGEVRDAQDVKKGMGIIVSRRRGG